MKKGEKMVLIVDDKISLGQCFNLAHNEMNRGGVPNKESREYMKTRTLELFELKKEIGKELDEKHGV